MWLRYYQLELKLKWEKPAQVTCCHHIMELALGSVFNNMSRATAQTAVAMFKRFQQRWPTSTEERQSCCSQYVWCAHWQPLSTWNHSFLGAVGANMHTGWQKTIYNIKLFFMQQLSLVKNSTVWRSWQSLWALSMSNPALVWSPTAYKHTVEWPANQGTCEIPGVPKHDRSKGCINFGFFLKFWPVCSFLTTDDNRCWCEIGHGWKSSKLYAFHQIWP